MRWVSLHRIISHPELKNWFRCLEVLILDSQSLQVKDLEDFLLQEFFGRLYALVRLLKLIWTQLRCFLWAYETICKYGPTLLRRGLRKLVGNQIFSNPNHLLYESAQPFLLASLRKSVWTWNSLLREDLRLTEHRKGPEALHMGPKTFGSRYMFDQDEGGMEKYGDLIHHPDCNQEDVLISKFMTIEEQTAVVLENTRRRDAKRVASALVGKARVWIRTPWTIQYSRFKFRFWFIRRCCDVPCAENLQISKIRPGNWPFLWPSSWASHLSPPGISPW